MSALTFERLRRMSAGEIAVRGRQQAFKWFERLSAPPAQARVRRAMRRPTAVRKSMRAAFAGVADGRTADTVLRRCPAEAARLVQSAERILDGQVDLLGYAALPLPSPIEWTRDLVSGQVAPDAHWSLIDPLAPEAVGDSKVVWELNRHQWIVQLAQASRLTGDARFARHGSRMIADWIARQPRGRGVNWASSLEVALRLIAWAWFVAIAQDDVLGTAELAAIEHAMHEHASHIERYLSTYFSPNTHLTGEALGLFYAGAIVDGRDGSRWRRTGAEVLIAECAKQVSDDGAHVEQATCYQRYTLEIYLHFLLLADWTHEAVPSTLRQSVARMAEYLVGVNQPAGRMPGVGDADGGWILPLTPRTGDDARGVIALAAAYFDRPDFAWAAGAISPEAIWMLGRGGVDVFDSLEPAPPSCDPSRFFEQAGVVVMRSEWSADATRVLFDAGPLWRGNCRGHGHADLLSLQLTVGSEDWLVDSGTYCYTADPAWRRHFRSTPAHNTLTVDGCGQVEPVGPFGWARNAHATLRAWRTDAAADYADADHSAFADLSDPVRHRRRVLFVKPDIIVVIDDVYGRARHLVEGRWQWSRAVESHDAQWFEGRAPAGSLWLKTFSAPAMTTRVACGSAHPIEGWISDDYGQKRPSPVLVTALNARLPVRLVTVILPRPVQAGRPSVRTSVGADGFICSVHVEDRSLLVEIDDADVVFRLS